MVVLNRVIILFLFFVFCSGSIFWVDSSLDGVSEAIIAGKILKLHEIQGPKKKNMVWGECGELLRGEGAEKRAFEYADAILSSIRTVYRKTGEMIDYRHVLAILYRESSNDECVVGHQETKRLARNLGRLPKGKDLFRHINSWSTARRRAFSWCRHRIGNEEPVVGEIGRCAKAYLNREYPQYRDIRGWDIGAAQYRWPRPGFKKRHVLMPKGRLVRGIGLSELLEYDVAVQILVEDLARHKSVCRRMSHRHYAVGGGMRVRRLSVEESYYAHHHTGIGKWSHRYWVAVGRHLKVIDDGGDAIAWLRLR